MELPVPFEDGWQTVETPLSCPRQEDAVSCGIFVCVWADKISRCSHLKGVKINALQARKTISSVLRKGRFDQEDFSLIEKATSCRSPSGNCTPTVVLQVSTPNGLSEVECQNDPLLQEMSDALEEISHTIRVAFPPLIKTPKYEPTEVGAASTAPPPDQDTVTIASSSSFGERMEEDVPDQTEMLLPASALGENQDVPDHHTSPPSPCLSITTSDVEQTLHERPATTSARDNRAQQIETTEETTTGISNKPVKGGLSPLKRLTVTRVFGGRRVVGMAASSSSTEHPTTVTEPHKPRCLVTVKTKGAGRREVSNYVPKNRVYQPWIPQSLIKKAKQNCGTELTGRKKKNQRWRVYLSDGTFVRVRPHQLKDLPNRR